MRSSGVRAAQNAGSSEGSDNDARDKAVRSTPGRRSLSLIPAIPRSELYQRSTIVVSDLGRVQRTRRTFEGLVVDLDAIWR